MGLGIVAHHVDGRGPCDRPSLYGLSTAEYPISDGNPESSKIIPSPNDLNRPDHCGWTASRRSTRNRGWFVGGGILVA